MAQGLITCALRGLAVVGTATAGFEPTIVGGSDALATDDDGASYVELVGELGAYPDSTDPPMVVGSFDAAAIPDGHLVTGVFLAVKMRGGVGADGDAQVEFGAWDGAVYSSRADADDAGYLLEEFVYPPGSASWEWADWEYDGYPELGFRVIPDARNWSFWQVDEGFGYSFSLENLRAGLVRGYLRTPGFWGGGDYRSQVGTLRLIVRHAPIPDPYPASAGPAVYSSWLPVPDLIGKEEGYSGDYYHASLNVTRTGLGGGVGSPWNAAGIDAFYEDMKALTPPGGGVSDVANGLYTSFVFERLRANVSTPNVNLQFRTALWKALPGIPSLFINNSSFGGSDLWVHQRAGLDDDPTWDLAGLVDTSDAVTDWASYRVEVLAFYVRLVADVAVNNAGSPPTMTHLMRHFPAMEGRVPEDSEDLVATDYSSVDSRVGPVPVGRERHATWPAVSAIAATGLTHLQTVDAGAVGDPPWVDVTGLVVEDSFGLPCVWLHLSQGDQNSSNPFDLAPGAFANTNPDWERSIHGNVYVKVDLGFPDRRFPYLGLEPLFAGGSGAWIRQRQVGALAQRRAAQGRATGRGRQARWR